MTRTARTFVMALLVMWTGLAWSQTPLRMAITQDEGTLTPYTYQTGYPGYELMTLISYRPDAYDGWSYMTGQGIIHKGSFVRP